MCNQDDQSCLHNYADGILVRSDVCNFATFLAGFVIAQLAKETSGNSKPTTLAKDVSFANLWLADLNC